MSTRDLHRLIPLGLLLVSCVALGSALVSQYVFGLRPCVLCLWQRVPWGLVALTGLVAVLATTSRPGRRMATALAGVFLAVGAGLAIFHVGVEQGLWAGTDACGGATGPMALDDIRRAMDAPAVVSCAEVPWSLFGISMAGYNAVFSAVLALACLGAVLKADWWKRVR